MNLNSCEVRRLKIVCAGDICFSNKLKLKFRNILEYSEAPLLL